MDIPQAAADGRPGKSAPDVTEWRAIVARFQEPSLPRATWQLVNTLGGFRTQGRDAAAAERLIADARAVEAAGAFSVVIEGTVAEVAERMSQAIAIPTIGIGASAACDGQVLVIDDLLGAFTEFTPKFVKKYADLAGVISTAAAAYAEDVRTRTFPGPEHVV